MSTGKVFFHRESLRFGWEVFNANVSYFLVAIMGIALSYGALWFGLGILGTAQVSTLFSIGLFALVVTVNSIIGVGWFTSALHAAQGKRLNFSVFTQPDGQLLWKYFLASVLLGILGLVGTLLFIIPGIMVMMLFIFFPFSLVEQPQRGLGKSLTASRQVSSGARWSLFAFMVIIMVINAMGAIFIGIGLLITLPVTTIALAHAYLRLQEQEQDNASENITTPAPAEKTAKKHQTKPQPPQTAKQPPAKKTTKKKKPTTKASKSKKPAKKKSSRKPKKSS